MASSSRKPIKIDRVFRAFLEGRSFNRFEAEQQLSDHCLPSTVSSIHKRYGVRLLRHWEWVPGYQGSPAHVLRYWITPEDRRRYLAREDGQTKKSPTSNQTDRG